jgi:hygromycin-B 7''-O-kinase
VANDGGEREYSSRLGVLSRAQLQRALHRFGLGELLKAEPALGGNFGQNVFLTSTAGEWVLRGCPHYTWQLPKEMFFARLIRERSQVRTPWPYMIEENCEIFGWSFALMPRLPGIQLDDKSRSQLAEDDRLEIAGALGRELALMHDVRWPYCADNATPDDHLNTDVLVPMNLSYRDWIAAKVERRIAMCRAASDAMTDADADWCRGLLAAGEDALGAAFDPTLVHHDYKEKQPRCRARRRELARQRRVRPHGVLLRTSGRGPGACGPGLREHWTSRLCACVPAVLSRQSGARERVW